MTVWLVWVNDACTDVCATKEIALRIASNFRRMTVTEGWEQVSRTRWYTTCGRYARLEVEERDVWVQ